MSNLQGRHGPTYFGAVRKELDWLFRFLRLEAYWPIHRFMHTPATVRRDENGKSYVPSDQYPWCFLEWRQRPGIWRVRSNRGGGTIQTRCSNRQAIRKCKYVKYLTSLAPLLSAVHPRLAPRAGFGGSTDWLGGIMSSFRTAPVSECEYWCVNC